VSKARTSSVRRVERKAKEKRRRIEQKREKATKEVRIGRRRHSWSTAIYVCCDCVFVVGVGVDRFGFRSQSKIE
jgi:hypothetical protein